MKLYGLWLKLRTPFRSVWWWWTHRNETVDERKQRIEQTITSFREIYEKHREHLMERPATREVQEAIEFWDQVIGESKTEDFDEYIRKAR
jgi:hypothetical protein